MLSLDTPFYCKTSAPYEKDRAAGGAHMWYYSKILVNFSFVPKMVTPFEPFLLTLHRAPNGA